MKNNSHKEVPKGQEQDVNESLHCGLINCGLFIEGGNVGQAFGWCCIWQCEQGHMVATKMCIKSIEVH